MNVPVTKQRGEHEKKEWGRKILARKAGEGEKAPLPPPPPDRRPPQHAILTEVEFLLGPSSSGQFAKFKSLFGRELIWTSTKKQNMYDDKDNN